MHRKSYITIVQIFIFLLLGAILVSCGGTGSGTDPIADDPTLDTDRLLANQNTFIHQKHRFELGYACTTCHNKKGKKHVPPPSKCFNCHTDPLDSHEIHIDSGYASCSDCHQVHGGMDPDELDCLVCHTDYQVHYVINSIDDCWICHID